MTVAATPPSASEVKELWYTRCPLPSASSVAIHLGWFEREFERDDIRVASLRADRTRSTRESHFDHSQENSFRQGGNIPPIWARSLGRDTKLLALSFGQYYQGILAMPDSGIQSPSDLAGKRLALPRRVNDQIDFNRAGVLRGYMTALSQAGLSIDDVTLVDLLVTETYIAEESESQRGQLFSARSMRRFQTADLIALVRGEVDAIFVSGGRGVDFETLLGANVVCDIGGSDSLATRTSNIVPIVLTVNGSLVDSRPDIVARYIATMLVASEWAVAHPSETRRIVALESGTPEAWIELAHGDVHAALTPILTDDLLGAVVSQKDFLLANGFIADDFDVHEWVDPVPLSLAHELVADGTFGAEWRGSA